MYFIFEDDNTSLFIQVPLSNKRTHYPLLLRKMASFSVEDFVGNGVLKDLLPMLLEEGWDDIPTLKIMNSEDTDAMNMTRQQKVGYLEFASRFSFDQNLLFNKHWLLNCQLLEHVEI